MTRTLRRPHGLTLIEVMVAIAIFAVLGVLSYRAVSSMIATRDRMEAEYARWRQIARVMQLIENDLTQLAPRPQSGTTQGAATLSLMRGGQLEQLTLLRHDGSNGGVEQHIWHIEDQTLLLTRQRISSDTPGSDDAMLQQVKSLNWRFVTRNGQEVDAWPQNANMANELPAAIRMQLELADVGKISRVFAVH
ncbi:GspJ family T2SS minor pseudopilin variant XcpW [Niveibacterium umoris]|uniref:Type II secretion system protein J n=1 Tax=Niveibacterium umoris TaxID=1193620 RepID=A0A840BLI1_9RHOO|nr:type II secretion system minor pseudopilin GspJ [Niveibacterium umoris]MBB4012389.1 general secretion pathway protein J [Niveibacterium umoris]